jgi:hypothetical protein
MENRRWLKIECLHMVGDPESKGLKIAALNLFHPTASPFFWKAVFSYYERSPEEGCPCWGGWQQLGIFVKNASTFVFDQGC